MGFVVLKAFIGKFNSILYCILSVYNFVNPPSAKYSGYELASNLFLEFVITFTQVGFSSIVVVYNL